VTIRLRRVLFALFFVSGFCGLLYQVVWLRLAFAEFGIVTPVLSTVISVFMLGLALGTYVGGRLIEWSPLRARVPAIFPYGIAEMLIAVGAVAVPALFARGGHALLSAGAQDSGAYLLRSALWIGASLLPWCFLMGTTIPFMMAFARDVDRAFETSFSFLYVANVIGAMCGAAVTAGVLVEIMGFRRTLLCAAAANLAIAVTALALTRRYRAQAAGPTRPARPAASVAPEPKTPVRLDGSASDPPSAAPILLLFTTGFASMAMEVVWTRAFTPVLRTNIYSFASILTVYLLATWLGSALYRRHLAGARLLPTSTLIGLLALFAFLPILIADARLLPTRGRPWVFFAAAALLASILPFSALLGYLTPKLIDGYARGRPRPAGTAYAVNIVGCILGPLAAGYILLPRLGVRYSLVLLALPLAIFQLARLGAASRWTRRRGALAASSALAMAAALFGTVSLEEGKPAGRVVIRRDHTATVICQGEGMEKRMLVNGIPMTFLTPITKNMAHLPLLHCTQPPRSALVICFGMGTTFRSLMSWDLDVTAVELVPSVVKSFPYFFEDGERLAHDPRATIVVDDGRRFLTRTDKIFDVITLDPPPPLEAAGSSLLYSREILDLVRARLRPGGILQHWFPGGDERTLKAVVLSLGAAFPYVKVFHSMEGWGYHFLASDRPIPSVDEYEAARRITPKIQRDLLEWSPGVGVDDYLNRLLEPQIDFGALVDTTGAPMLTDDRPYNEYFLLRRTWDRATGQFRFAS
jgi:spermidine synthase